MGTFELVLSEREKTVTLLEKSTNATFSDAEIRFSDGDETFLLNRRTGELTVFTHEAAQMLFHCALMDRKF